MWYEQLNWCTSQSIKSIPADPNMLLMLSRITTMLYLQFNIQNKVYVRSLMYLKFMFAKQQHLQTSCKDGFLTNMTTWLSYLLVILDEIVTQCGFKIKITLFPMTTPSNNSTILVETHCFLRNTTLHNLLSAHSAVTAACQQVQRESTLRVWLRTDKGNSPVIFSSLFTLQHKRLSKWMISTALQQLALLQKAITAKVNIYKLK